MTPFPSPNRIFLLGLMLACAGAPHAATINQTLCVSRANKTMSDGATLEFWGFTTTCATANVGQVPGPPVVIGIGDTLNLTLSIPLMPMTTPFEMMNAYPGHTIHLHGADVATGEDGVPEFGAKTGGDTYTWTPTSIMGGSYMYHCHQHTVKHLEMGMYGPMIVRPKNAQGQFINQLTPDSATAYDVEQTYVFSSVDPAYHASTAVGDSTVFADYNPKYFLINGNEGVSAGSPSQTAMLSTSPNQKVALRLIGLHSVHGTFSIRDTSNGLKPFTVYVQDGRQYAVPETVTSLDIAPGQRYDVIFTTPSTSGTWYPQFQYKRLRDGSAYPGATAYGRVSF